MSNIFTEVKSNKLLFKEAIEQCITNAVQDYPAEDYFNLTVLMKELLSVKTEPEIVEKINDDFQDDLVRKLLLNCLEDATVQKVEMIDSNEQRS